MEIYANPEEQIQCPYNNSHHIRRKRMNVHLTKCKRNYPDTPLVECDFNVNHKIPEPELQYHHENCRDRKKIEITIYQDTKTDLTKFPIINRPVPTEESWDNDNVASYDPQKYCTSKEIIRHLDVLPAAERRNFRLEERKRIGAIQRNADRDNLANNELRCSRAVANENQSRTNLPETRARDINEETPDSIAMIVQRIRIGANQPYIQKN